MYQGLQSRTQIKEIGSKLTSILTGSGETVRQESRGLFSTNNHTMPQLLAPEDQLLCIEKDVTQLESQLIKIREVCSKTADGYSLKLGEVDLLIEGLSGVRQRVSDLKDQLDNLSSPVAGSKQQQQQQQQKPQIRVSLSDNIPQASVASASAAEQPVQQSAANSLIDQMQLGQLFSLPTPFLLTPGTSFAAPSVGTFDLSTAFTSAATAGGAYGGIDMLRMLQQQQIQQQQQQQQLQLANAAKEPPKSTPKKSNEKDKTLLPQDLSHFQQQQQQQLHLQQHTPAAHWPPLDTNQIASDVRTLLSRHNIGQRLFAKQVLGLSQGTVSELLSKPKQWDKLTEKGRESYRKMKIWASDESSVLGLKAMAPVKRGLHASEQLAPSALADQEPLSLLSLDSRKQQQQQQPPQLSLLNPTSVSAAAAAATLDSDASRSSCRSDEFGGQLVMDAPQTQQQQQPPQQHLLLPPMYLATAANLSTDIASGMGSHGTTRDIVRGIYQDQLRTAMAQAKAEGDQDAAERLAMEMQALEADSLMILDERGEADQSSLSQSGLSRKRKRQPSQSTLFPTSAIEQQQQQQQQLDDSHSISVLNLGSSPGTMSSLKQSKLLLPPITKEQIEKYWDLNTEDLVREVKELLNQYSISQRLFGEQVLGLSQGSVSDLLARPKPWSMLTQKGREPFIRMRLFVDQPDALNRLVATNQSMSSRQSSSSLTSMAQLIQQQQQQQRGSATDPVGTSLMSAICANAASYLPDSTIAQLANSITFDIDTRDVCDSVLETMQRCQMTCSQLGQTVLGLSAEDTAELLESPQPWHQLTAKGREPYLRLNLWLASSDHQVVSATPPSGTVAGNSNGNGANNNNSSSDLLSDGASSTDSPLGHGTPSKKSRYMFTDAQKSVLQEVFLREPYPTGASVEQLAEEFRLPVKTVSNWFHNHRMRNKTAALLAGGAGRSAEDGLDLRNPTAVQEPEKPQPPPQQQQQQQQQSRRKASKPVRLLSPTTATSAAVTTVKDDS